MMIKRLVELERLTKSVFTGGLGGGSWAPEDDLEQVW